MTTIVEETDIKKNDEYRSDISNLGSQSPDLVDQESQSQPYTAKGEYKSEEENPVMSQSSFSLSQFRDVDSGEIRVRNNWGTITEPNGEEVYVRGKNYIENSQKIKSKGILFPLVAAECIRTPKRINHLAQSEYHTWYHNHIDPKDENIFVLIIQLQVQSLNSAFVHYHVWEGGLPVTTESEEFNKLFAQVLYSDDDDFRSGRLKLIPRIVSGPFAVQTMVKNSPVLLGTKVKQHYYRGVNYFEIDSEVDESYISSGIIKLCHRFSRNIVVDMCWVIEGQKEEELPERAMCGITIHNLDFSRVTEINPLDPNNLAWKQRQQEQQEQQQSRKMNNGGNPNDDQEDIADESTKNENTSTNDLQDIEENSTTAETEEYLKKSASTDSHSQSTKNNQY